MYTLDFTKTEQKAQELSAILPQSERSRALDDSEEEEHTCSKSAHPESSSDISAKSVSRFRDAAPSDMKPSDMNLFLKRGVCGPREAVFQRAASAGKGADAG